MIEDFYNIDFGFIKLSNDDSKFTLIIKDQVDKNLLVNNLYYMKDLDNITCKINDFNINIKIKDLDDDIYYMSWPEFYNTKLLNVLNEIIVKKEEKKSTAIEDHYNNKNSEKTFVSTFFRPIFEYLGKCKINITPKYKTVEKMALLGDKVIKNLAYNYFSFTNGYYKLDEDDILIRQNMLKNELQAKTIKNLIKDNLLKELENSTIHTGGTIFEAVIYLAVKNKRYDIAALLFNQILKLSILDVNSDLNYYANINEDWIKRNL